MILRTKRVGRVGLVASVALLALWSFSCATEATSSGGTGFDASPGPSCDRQRLVETMNVDVDPAVACNIEQTASIYASDAVVGTGAFRSSVCDSLCGDGGSERPMLCSLSPTFDASHSPCGPSDGGLTKLVSLTCYEIVPQPSDAGCGA